MWARAIAAVAVAGCGRVGFDAVDLDTVGLDAVDADQGEGAPVVAMSDLVAWYPMRTFDGGLLVDATGHGHDGTCSSMCPQLAPGRYGNGLAFDGTQWMTAMSGSDLAFPTGFTITSWFFTPSAPPTRGHPLTTELGTGILDSWGFLLDTDVTVTIFADGATSQSFGGATPLTIGEWHHVAVRWNGTQLDGLIDGALYITGPVTDVVFDTNPINFGADFEFGAPLLYFTGTLDDVRIYKRALTDAEVGDLAR